MIRLSLGVLIACLSGLMSPALAFGQCDVGHKSETYSDPGECNSESDSPRTSRGWDIWTTTVCPDGGWRTTQWSSTSVEGTSSGACYGCIGEVYLYDTGSGRFQLETADITKDESGVCRVYKNYSYHYAYADGCYGWCCQLQAECTAVGEWLGSCTCVLSPLILDLDGGGLSLTDAATGVRFDLDRNGTRELRAWTSAADDAFLVLDRNGNAAVDDGGELFGSPTDQPPCENPNGFNALTALDANHDGSISAADPEFAHLRAWLDRNHDGVSQPEELLPLTEARVAWISLDFKESRAKDSSGNLFRYRAKVGRVGSGGHVTPSGWAVDVFLRGLP